MALNIKHLMPVRHPDPSYVESSYQISAKSGHLKNEGKYETSQKARFENEQYWKKRGMKPKRQPSENIKKLDIL